MPEQWQEAGDEPWSYNATIKIFEKKVDYIEHICTPINCESIWISINAMNTDRNKKTGEYRFHSIVNNAPAYRDAENNYFAYDGYKWLILSQYCFQNNISCGWFRIFSKGIFQKSKHLKMID